MKLRSGLTRMLAVTVTLGSMTPLCARAVAAGSGTSSPQAARAALNREQAAIARRQLDQDAANDRAFQDAKAARQAQIAHDEQAYQDEKARRAAEYDAAMAAWREDVAACRHGDTARCRQR